MTMKGMIAAAMRNKRAVPLSARRSVEIDMNERGVPSISIAAML